MKQFWFGLIFLVSAGTLGAYYAFGTPRVPVSSPDTAQTLPRGKGFDFYVLALSWSPTYCQENSARRRDAEQCGGPRPFGFVVHGLWPQFEQGYPRACQTHQMRPTPAQAHAMMDIMPSERLVQHQWDNHGTCSGLSAPDYLRVTRAAAKRVRIPAVYASASQWRRVSAEDVESAFIAANSSLTDTGIAIAQRGQNLSEVRICLTLNLTVRACPEVDQNGVRRQTRLSLPPSRN